MFLSCPHQNGVFRFNFKNLSCPLVPRHFDLGSYSSLIPKSPEKLIEKKHDSFAVKIWRLKEMRK